jgi:hypothetical protein
MSNTPNPQFHLVTTRGALVAPNPDACRPVHNQTAGNPQGVEGAKSLSDLSHQVFVPLMGGKNELLFMDTWYDPKGRKMFFSDPQVEQGGKAIFASYERTIWLPAQDILHYFVAAPYGQNERFLGLVRGTVKSRAEAVEVFNRSRAAGLNAARRAGSVWHQIYFRDSGEGSPTLELLGVDLWTNGDQMMGYYEKFDNDMGGAFNTAPEPSVWKRPAGDWVEW